MALSLSVLVETSRPMLTRARTGSAKSITKWSKSLAWAEGSLLYLNA